ncbi:MAG: 2OG-Fe(II) oxygenase [Sphingomicrobium sp.]
MTPMPSFHHYLDFLEPAQEASLLAHALAEQDRFKPSNVSNSVYDPERRQSVRLRNLGPTKSWFEEKIRDVTPNMFEQTGMQPFDVEFLELELAAHGDGAHFAIHSDIPIGPNRVPLGGDDTGRQDRLLSAVFYFYREPKGFSGGQLRLHRFGSNGEPGDYVDIEPVRNSLVVFPSWTSHEVRKVRCPSGTFEDYRFAVNCWLCATRF